MIQYYQDQYIEYMDQSEKPDYLILERSALSTIPFMNVQMELELLKQKSYEENKKLIENTKFMTNDCNTIHWKPIFQKTCERFKSREKKLSKLMKDYIKRLEF